MADMDRWLRDSSRTWSAAEADGAEDGNGYWPAATGGGGTAEAEDEDQRSFLLELKGRIHRQLLERLNLTSLGHRDQDDAREAVREVIRDLLAVEEVPLNLEEREELAEQVLDEVFGFGPLEPLLKDPDVTDILVNTYDQVYVERHGKLKLADVSFRDDDHLLQVLDRIVSGVGRRIDDSSPMVDARLPDGSRVNAIIPPLSIDGPHISIRKFRTDVLTDEDLLRNDSITREMLVFMQGAVKAKLNILISGGTGSGKTTLLNVLSESIPVDERIVTIEDSAELQLRQPHTVRLETRPPNVEGEGEVGQRQLVINSLRMRPDRIIVGEVRGGEAIDMLQAMNTGHEGSLTTLHANSPRDALARLETMVSMANLNIPEKGIRQQIANGIDLVIHVARLSDGTRRVVRVSELVGMEGEIITMQDIFVFEREGVEPDGRVVGRFRPTGIRPQCAHRLHTYGVDVPETLLADFESV